MSQHAHEVIDFDRSFVRWSRAALPHEIENPPDRPRGNSARIQIDSACTICENGKSESFYLIAPGRKEWMYRETNLFVEPNTEYRVIFSDDRQIDVSMHGHTGDQHMPPSYLNGFTEFAFQIETSPARPLENDAEVVDESLTGRPIVATVRLDSAVSSRTAELQFPVKTVNYHSHPMRFQVDTGPMIFADLDRSEENLLDRCTVAHVIFNCFDYAEFACRQPGVVSETGEMPFNYSRIEKRTATVTLHAIEELA